MAAEKEFLMAVLREISTAAEKEICQAVMMVTLMVSWTGYLMVVVTDY